MKSVNQLAVLEKHDIRFTEKLVEPLTAAGVEILQINVGKRCNLSCRHCHVEAGGDRKEVMRRNVFDACLEAAAKNIDINTIDVTGGAPEMNPFLKDFIKEAAKLGRRLIVRSNLVILAEDDYSGYDGFYAGNGVEIVSSLPDCDEARADRQRGAGFFRKFVEVVKKLNEMGYGKPGSGLLLNLVHNPVGAYLPASQTVLEQDYRVRLKNSFGIDFNSLYCINNMPVGRYLDFLIASGNYGDYMRTLTEAFNPGAVKDVMCRKTVSVSWDGTLYDCDFNQMLGLSIGAGYSAHIGEFDMERLGNRPIVLHNHCYGCTAGEGSSCHGSLQ
jgi:radical SAM/Cys-rich protein